MKQVYIKLAMATLVFCVLLAALLLTDFKRESKQEPEACWKWHCPHGANSCFKVTCDYMGK